MAPHKSFNRSTISGWRVAFLAFAIVFLLPLASHGVWWLSKDHPTSWHAADWSSAGLLPPPSEARQALVLVFAAPAGRWKGVFSVHSWIVIKKKDAPTYTRYDVAGWGRPVKIDHWAPDGRWYGNTPELVAAIEGEAAERLIPRIKSAVAEYPYSRAGDYRVWPGPNSNTFVAYVLAHVPEARITLPPNAIGKDFRNFGVYLGASPTRTGIQGSLFGLFGLTLAWVEALEVNLSSLVAGIDFRQFAIKLPGWGVMPLLPWLTTPAGGSKMLTGTSPARNSAPIETQ